LGVASADTGADSAQQTMCLCPVSREAKPQPERRRGNSPNPDHGLSWRPTKIEVAQSADPAYEMGTFDLTVADQTGKSRASPGKYVIEKASERRVESGG